MDFSLHKTLDKFLLIEAGFANRRALRSAAAVTDILQLAAFALPPMFPPDAVQQACASCARR